MLFDHFAGVRASKGRWRMWGALAVVLAASTARAQDASPPPAPPSGFRPRVVREGTLSLGMQGEYGSFVGSSGFGSEYNHGPSLAFRVRYRFAEDQAFGVSFEGQRFDAKVDSVGEFAPKYLTAITTTLEYYNYFQTRSRTPQYLMIGAGLFLTICSKPR